MPNRFHTGPQSGDPVYDELVRAFEDEVPKNSGVGPMLIGTNTASGGNLLDKVKYWFRNPMATWGDLIQGGRGGAPRKVVAATDEGMILMSYLDGGGHMQNHFVDPDTVGLGFDADDILVSIDGTIVVNEDGFVLVRS